MAMESQPPLAALALAITAQDWTCLGLGSDPNVAATGDFDVSVERITALLLARIVALVAPPLNGCRDLSTTSICRSAIVSGLPWPEPINDEVIGQLRDYVRRILSGYNDTPYHNWEHAYHVVISINKMLDLILNLEIHGKRRPPTYGFRNDPMMHFVLVFAALIHDVEHTGVPNRQLAIEDDPLAILYNDQAIAENRSLYIGFKEMLSDDFKLLRETIFVSKDEYLRFRKACVNVVLTTDIASPERTQIAKSKWKEAFGDPFETIERKVRSEIKKRNSISLNMNIQYGTQMRRASRCSVGSVFSEITTDVDHMQQHDEDGSDSLSGSRTPDSTDDDEYDVAEDDPDDGIIFSAVTQSAANNTINTAQAYTHSQTQLSNNHTSPDIRAELGYGSPSNSRPSLEGNTGSDSVGSASQSSAAGGQHHQFTHTTNRFSNNITNGTRLSKLLSERDSSSLDLGYDPMLKYGGGTTSSLDSKKIASYDSRRRSLSNVPDDGKIDSSFSAKFSRRLSTSSVMTSNSKKYKYRLGILRSVDLSGEAIETYSRSGSIVTGAGAVAPPGGRGGRSAANSLRKGSMGAFSSSGARTIETELEVEDVDELKITVILETMISAADVAHNLQGWDHMVKWSTKLFMELKKAYKAGRGADPKHRWFENQIGFLESYLLPLARRLEDTGVFGDIIGSAFTRIVESNRDRWLTDGLVVTSGVILEGAKKFPVEGDISLVGHNESDDDDEEDITNTNNGKEEELLQGDDRDQQKCRTQEQHSVNGRVYPTAAANGNAVK